MRAMRTYVGSTAGNDGGAKGLPEIQESVLEHSPTEAQKPQVMCETLPQNSDVIKLLSRIANATKDGITDIIVSFTGMYRPMAESITDEIVSLLEPDTSCLSLV